MNEFKRMVIKVSDVTTEVATIPTTNDHTDGSWLNTDIYVGELFLNITDDILQTRTDAGIITLNSGGGGGSSAWGSITGTLSSQTDLQNALNLKLESGDNVSSLLNDAGYITSNTVDSVNGLTGVVVLGKTEIGLGNVDNTSDANKPISTATQTGLNLKQDTLVSGTNIKTINSNTLLGSGNFVIDTSWGAITGTLSSQTDLATALDNTTLISTLTIGVSRSLLLTDRDKNIENDNNITITIPLNSSVAFPIGTQIFFTKKAESMDFAVAGGVTLNSVDSLVDMGRINCGASLLKINTDTWNLIGELV